VENLILHHQTARLMFFIILFIFFFVSNLIFFFLLKKYTEFKISVKDWNIPNTEDDDILYYKLVVNF